MMKSGRYSLRVLPTVVIHHKAQPQLVSLRPLMRLTTCFVPNTPALSIRITIATMWQDSANVAFQPQQSSVNHLSDSG